LKMTTANSTEMDKETEYPIISLLEEQKTVSDRGATMRLGSYPCLITKDTKAFKAYGKTQIHERHRHRYELNNIYRTKLEEAGLKISGLYKEGNLAEIVEVESHPWMVGVQFHPEFKSKLVEPHPLFCEFVRAMIQQHRVEHHAHTKK